MKSFFDLFKSSYKELTGKNGVICIVITGLLIAVSMAIEAFTIEIPFAKINFAFLAIASIGMLFGPTVSFIAGGLCDIVGFMVHPDGGFLPLYTLIGMFQGLIYGIILYRRWGNMVMEERSAGKRFCEMAVRLVAARLCDVIIVNLLMNTAANMYYGFIPQQAYGAAIAARVVKNLLQLCADIPLMFIIMPIVLTAFTRTIGRNQMKAV
ncbi:MAG: folate family ECF transporter S component [Huintestinicola sp.]